MPAALDVQHLSFQYPGGVKALDDVHFSVEEGEIFGLLGPNGGGKTTLFKILSTMALPSSGTVKVFGADILQEPGETRRRIGVVFQSPSIDRKLTVHENMLHQGRLYGLSGARLKDKIGLLLKKFGLFELRLTLAETLSGGLKRRLEIAKSLIQDSKFILLDEPSTGLDPGARMDLWKVLRDLKADGISVLITTHLMEEAEKCGRIAILNKGKIVALSTPEALKKEIGGDIITVETESAEKLSQELFRKYSIKSVIMDRFLRIERERGHELVPELVRSFPDDILSISLGKPTLEDVFIHRTGHKFWND